LLALSFSLLFLHHLYYRYLLLSTTSNSASLCPLNVLCFIISPGIHLLYPVNKGIRNITHNQELFTILARDKHTNIISVMGIILKYCEYNRISNIRI
jgi:hypothetical protein